MYNNKKTVMIFLLVITICLIMVGCQTSEDIPTITTTFLNPTSVSSQTISTTSSNTTNNNQTTGSTNSQIITTTTTKAITTSPIENITVPNFIGMNMTQLEESGMIINKVYQYSRDILKDIVISQSIKEGLIVEKNQEIILTVSDGLPIITYGYDLTTLNVPSEYTHGQYYFTINQYDNNVFLRIINGIVVTHQLIITDCHSMLFDQNETIYYQKISDKNLYSFNLSSRENKKIVNEVVNEYHLNETTLFYATNTQVKAYSISSQNITTIASVKTTFFQVVNHLYYLSNENGNTYLYEYNGTTNKKLLEAPISSFIIHDFRAYYYENNNLFYVDLLNGQSYQATSEQQAQLYF